MAKIIDMEEQKEKAFCTELMFQMWDKWQEELLNASPEEKAELQRYLKPFMELTGAEKDSPLYMMYHAFIGGVNKGIELAERLHKTESPTCGATQAGQATKPTRQGLQ